MDNGSGACLSRVMFDSQMHLYDDGLVMSPINLPCVAARAQLRVFDATLFLLRQIVIRM
jgi:hypothetical protein